GPCSLQWFQALLPPRIAAVGRTGFGHGKRVGKSEGWLAGQRFVAARKRKAVIDEDPADAPPGRELTNLDFDASDAMTERPGEERGSRRLHRRERAATGRLERTNCQRKILDERDRQSEGDEHSL